MHSQKSCHIKRLLNCLHSFLPETPLAPWLEKKNAFSRDRKFSFRHVVAFCLSHVGSPDKNGLSITMQRFIRNARRSGLWPEGTAIDKSCISRARNHISWQFFETLVSKVVTIAYSLWKDEPWHTWHNLSVFAVDGSKFRLPATEAIREEFDPKSGQEYDGKGHYPQCLVSTAYDVFRRIPVARIIDKVYSCERGHALALLPQMPQRGIIMFDRGYPSYEILAVLAEKYQSGYFVMRCPSSRTFPAVASFVTSEKEEAILTIKPTQRYCRENPHGPRRILTVRAIRLHHPDGTTSVILTNLPRKKYLKEAIIELYFRRWEIENYYRDEKVTMELETFHTRSPRGIRQELYCAVIVSVLARIIMMKGENSDYKGRVSPQFKNALMTIAEDISILGAKNSKIAFIILNEMIDAVQKVKHYKPLKKRSNQPRASKRPVNKWQKNRRKRMAAHKK